MWQTLLGALLAVLGGWGAIWYQSRNTRKNRMEEITAERKVTANAQAYAYAKEIVSALVQESANETLQRILHRERWFFDNRLYLPGTFPNKWLSTRNDLSKLVRWETDASKTAEQKSSLEERIKRTLNEAIDDIYKDMNLQRIEIDDVHPRDDSPNISFNGWQRIGIVMSILWVIITSGYAMYELAWLSHPSSLLLTEVVVAKTGEPVSALKDNPFGNLVPVEHRLAIGRFAEAAFLPILVAWALSYLCRWVVRWIAAGFKHSGP